MATITLTPVSPARTRVRELFRRARRLPNWYFAVGVGVLGFLTSFVGSWIPAFWGDEAASVLSAERPLPSLFRMLGHVDAVHGTYYLFLHFWIDLFGPSELSVRFPSTIAAGFMVAGVFVVGTQLSSRRLGLVAAILAAVIPRTIEIGSDARSYAISTAIGVWLTVLLVRLVHHRITSRLAWLGYGLGVALGLYFFLYLALLVAVHAAFVAIRGRGVRARWVQAAVLGFILASPIAYFGYQERAQIAFLAHRDYATFPYITLEQWFGGGAPELALVAWALAAIALVAVVVTTVRHRRLSSTALLAFLWMFLPTILLLAVSVVSPSYNLRYLSQSIPGVALVLAMGILSIRARWFAAAGTIAAVAIATPFVVAEHVPYAFDDSDLSEVAAYVQHDAQPGDAVVFDDSVRPSGRPRLALRLYPEAFAGLIDVQLVTPYDETDGLWDKTAPLSAVENRLVTTNRVLLFENVGSTDYTNHDDLNTLEADGFVLQTTHVVHRTVVYTLTRDNQ